MRMTVPSSALDRDQDKEHRRVGDQTSDAGTGEYRHIDAQESERTL